MPLPLGEMLIGQPDLGETLMRGLELKGDLPQALHQRIDPSVQVVNLDAFEYWFLRRKVAFTQFRAQAAVAANVSQLFFMPPVRRTLVQVRRITVTNAGAAAAQYNIALSNLGILGGAGPVFGFQQDDRFGLTISGSQLLAGTNAAAQITTASMGVRSFIIPPLSSIVLDCDYMLSTKNFSPTALFCVMGETSAVNIPMAWTIDWTERAVLDSEL